jgi:hypothetical protein
MGGDETNKHTTLCMKYEERGILVRFKAKSMTVHFAGKDLQETGFLYRLIKQD